MRECVRASVCASVRACVLVCVRVCVCARARACGVFEIYVNSIYSTIG